MFALALVLVAILWELYKLIGPQDGGKLFMKIQTQNTPCCLRRANVAGIEILLDFIDFVVGRREFHNCSI
jgi:hypothetical protein